VASEELKKTEIIIFEKENKEYELEIKLKDDKGLILHLKRINYEKEHELKCKRDDVKRKEQEVQDEEERLRRLEEEIEEDLSVTQYSLNESKKRLKELEQKREEAKHRE
jgi:small-conductance mechanosensitive channel